MANAVRCCAGASAYALYVAVASRLCVCRSSSSGAGSQKVSSRLQPPASKRQRLDISTGAVWCCCHQLCAAQPLATDHAHCAAAGCTKACEQDKFSTFHKWAAELTPPPKSVARPCMTPSSLIVLDQDLEEYLVCSSLMQHMPALYAAAVSLKRSAS